MCVRSLPGTAEWSEARWDEPSPDADRGDYQPGDPTLLPYPSSGAMCCIILHCPHGSTVGGLGAFHKCLGSFYQQWKDNPLVMLKWLGTQAASPVPLSPSPPSLSPVLSPA